MYLRDAELSYPFRGILCNDFIEVSSGERGAKKSKMKSPSLSGLPLPVAACSSPS